jgi:hypothetical protein
MASLAGSVVTRCNRFPILGSLSYDKLRKGRQTMYKIVRNHFDTQRSPNRRVIKRDLTLAEVQAHCRDPETSSKTCTKAAGKRRTERYGMWFDGFEEQ